MKSKRLFSTLLAAIFAVCCSIPVLAVNEGSSAAADLIFYRSKPTDTFSGEIDLSGRRGEITAVELSPTAEPALYLDGFEDEVAYFDSLYKSASQTLLITRNERQYELPVNFAVYDRVELEQPTGSVTLTVKDNRTLSPVANAEYALYFEGKKLKSGLITGADGKITITKLASGSYELRPVSPAAGYLPTDKTIPFTIGGLELSGGEDQIRTSTGKRYRVDENEVLIAGEYSPDISLEALKEEQIKTVTVTFKNYGAALDEKGTDKSQTFSSSASAEEAVNTAKNDGMICGPVLISYDLQGTETRSTCNYIQYVEKAAPTPSPTPVPPTPSPVMPTPAPNYNNGNWNGGSTTQATPTPVPTVAPTPSKGTLIISTSVENGQLSGYAFEVTGIESDGSAFEQTYKTEENGQITCTLPNGTFTVGLKEGSSSNKGIAITEPQNISITNGNTAYINFTLSVTERDLSLTVVDDDNTPLEGVTVGIFDPDEYEETSSAPKEKTSKSNATDISQEISLREQEAEAEERRQNPYDRKNALDIGISKEGGVVNFAAMPTKGLLAVILEAPEGYAVTGEAIPISEGWEGESMLLCQYVQVDISITGEATGKPVLDATAVLSDPEGEKLTEWEITDEAHTGNLPDECPTLLTLSTCANSQGEGRFAVVAARVK